MHKAMFLFTDRYVFSALNAVEAAFAYTLLGILVVAIAPWHCWTVPCLLAVITVVQFLYMTPALDIR